MDVWLHCLLVVGGVCGVEEVPVAKGTMARMSPLVDVRYLQRHLHQLAVLDVSWHMPTSQRDARNEFRQQRVPKAAFFDVDGVVDRRSQLPHMLPPPSAFRAAMESLPCHRADAHYVVYDAVGVFSAPRMWWTCQVMDYPHVSVLDGGLPAYKKMGGKLDTQPQVDYDMEEHVQKAMEAQARDTGWKGVVHPRLARLEDVQNAMERNDVQYIDARSRPRFAGDVPEPRPGLRRGHVPGSINVPFEDMLQADGTYKSTQELKRVFEEAGVDMDKSIIVGCGTGVTACIVALGLEVLGHPRVAVYDGSWTEWASREDTPIVQGSA